MVKLKDNHLLVRAYEQLKFPNKVHECFWIYRHAFT